MNRRQFIERSALLGGSFLASGSLTNTLFADHHKPAFKISLAQWSLHKTINGKKLDNLDFAQVTRQKFGIKAVEYVNQFFKDKAKDKSYLTEMKIRANYHNVTSLLIMCDGEGQLGHPDQKERDKAVQNHHKWVEAAKFLGCHSIRVNAASKGSYEEQQKLAADGLRKLCEFADPFDMNVIVENHGGLSSNGSWLAEVIKMVDHPRAGTLPDFGNFRVDEDTVYDRYKGVTELMPYARAVSAKSHEFNENGDEIHTDYFKMMEIVLKAGYSGYVGIEYEGSELDEFAGIRATKALLERVLAKQKD